jgi:hypothetical protein
VLKRRLTPFALVLASGLLAGCGGPAVADFSPPVSTAATYGSGSWAFTASFLARPSHTGVTKVRRRDREVFDSGNYAVASDSYHASFTYGREQYGLDNVRIVEFLRPLPLHGCVLGLLERVKGPCPARHGTTLARGVNPCFKQPSGFPPACIGYDGGVLDVKGRMVFELQVVGGSRASVRAVVDSFSIAQ